MTDEKLREFFISAEKRSGKDRKELAEEVGVTTSAIGSWINTTREPGTHNLTRFINALGISYEEYLNREFKNEKYDEGNVFCTTKDLIEEERTEIRCYSNFMRTYSSIEKLIHEIEHRTNNAGILIRRIYAVEDSNKRYIASVVNNELMIQEEIAKASDYIAIAEVAATANVVVKGNPLKKAVVERMSFELQNGIEVYMEDDFRDYYMKIIELPISYIISEKIKKISCIIGEKLGSLLFEYEEVQEEDAHS